MNFQSASGAASRMDAVGCAESERGSNFVKRQCGGFCPEAPKEWHFLRETRQICRDGSGRQLPFSTNAERNDASFAKRDEYAAMVQGGRSLSPQVLKGCCSIRETRQICCDGSGLQLLFSANAKEQRFLRETRQFCFGQLSRRALLFRKRQRHAHQLRSAAAPLSPAAAETKNSIFCFFAKGRHDFVALRQKA